MLYSVLYRNVVAADVELTSRVRMVFASTIGYLAVVCLRYGAVRCGACSTVHPSGVRQGRREEEALVSTWGAGGHDFSMFRVPCLLPLDAVFSCWVAGGWGMGDGGMGGGAVPE